MATPQERHPELFKPVSYESPRGKKRTVPMECLCLGFNRTGTASMTAALEMLGVHCFHSISFFSTNFADIEMWQDAVDRKFFGAGPKFGRAEFDQLLHDFGAVSSDTPAIAFADDLIEAYPEAKVVLVERDIEPWFESWMNAVIKIMVGSWPVDLHSSASISANSGLQFDPIINIAYHIDRFYTRPIGRIHRSTLKGWADISSTEDARQKSKAKYREHYALVRKLTPKEQLLEFKLSDGWAPLCEFLGKPIPDKPFPHLNEKKWLDEKVQLGVIRGLKALAWRVCTFGAPVALAMAGYYVFAMR